MTYEQIAEMMEEDRTAFRLPSFCRGRKPCTAFFAVLISWREYVFGRQFGIFQLQTAGH